MTLPAFARECHNDLPASHAVVARIVDGDTLELSTRQHVRVIGVNTLEMKASDPRERQWAAQASDALDQLARGKNVTLLAGRDRTDRYGRLLAHVRLANGQDVAETLIKQGLGIAIGVGRNTACARDNTMLENRARSQHIGIWKEMGSWWSDNEPRLNAKRGFHLIRSEVIKRTSHGKKTKLQLANGLKVNLGHQWPLSALQTDTLLSRTDKQRVEVRGWIAGRLSSPEISLHHPANLQIITR